MVTVVFFHSSSVQRAVKLERNKNKRHKQIHWQQFYVFTGVSGVVLLKKSWILLPIGLWISRSTPTSVGQVGGSALLPEIHSSNICLGSSGVDTFNCRVDAILGNLGTSSLKIGMPLASCNRSRALKVNLPLRNDVTVDQIRRVIIKQVQKAKYDQVGVLCFFLLG